METLLQGLIGVFLYLDNLLVTGKTNQEHLNLTTVLQTLLAVDMKLKSEKCSFILQEVEYLD